MQILGHIDAISHSGQKHLELRGSFMEKFSVGGTYDREEKGVTEGRGREQKNIKKETLPGICVHNLRR